MKNKNLYWGIFFLLCGIFIIANQAGFFGKIDVVSVLATLFLGALVIHGLLNRDFFEIFISLSFLYMIYSHPLTLIYISPWVLILTAVLISIGFSMIFPKRRRKSTLYEDGKKHFSNVNKNTDNNNPYAKVALSSSCIYLNSECLQSGHFNSYLGDLKVYFDQVQLSYDSVEIFLDCNLGSIKLYIPRHWKVDDNINTIAGEVKYYNQQNKPSENAPRLALVGKVIMGNVEIHFI